VALGMAEARARGVVAAVAVLDRAAARAYLAGEGLTSTAVNDVLAATH
jgi:hypothetical protein